MSYRSIAGSAVWGRLLGFVFLLALSADVGRAQSGRGDSSDSKDRRGNSSSGDGSRGRVIEAPRFASRPPQIGSVNSGNTGVVWYRSQPQAIQPQPIRSPRPATPSLPAGPTAPTQGIIVRWVYYLPDGFSYMLQTDSGLFGPYALPPIEMPAEELAGPQAMQQFMGVPPVGGAAIGAQPQVAALPLAQNPPAGQGALPPPAGQQPFPLAGQAKPPPDARPNVRPSNAAARDRAWKEIELGDAQFGLRQYARALDHYRNAAAAAADLGDAFFRQAQAEVALSLSEQASRAIRRGLLFDPDWANSDFRLDQLYGDNKPIKDGRLSDLTKAAEAHPHDPAAQFLAGVELYFDDQLERAAPYLRRAATLYGPQSGVAIEGFLKRLPPPKPATQPAPNPPAPNKVPAADKGLDI